MEKQRPSQARVGSVKPLSTSEASNWSLFAREKIKIVIFDPLIRRLRVAMGNNSFCFVDLRYVRLTKFCQFCGRWGHGIGNCSTHKEYSSLIDDSWSEDKKKYRNY